MLYFRNFSFGAGKLPGHAERAIRGPAGLQGVQPDQPDALQGEVRGGVRALGRGVRPHSGPSEEG
jgi:hypothetical protein